MTTEYVVLRRLDTLALRDSWQVVGFANAPSARRAVKWVSGGEKDAEWKAVPLRSWGTVRT